LVTFSEQFDNAAWTKSGVTVTANQAISPYGYTNADLLTPTIIDSSIRQSTIPASVSAYTFSVWLRSATGSNISTTIRVWRDSPFQNITNTAITVTSTWQRFTLNFTPIDLTSHTVAIGGSSTLSSGENLFAWGAQLVEGTSALDYFPTTNRQDVPRIDFRNADGTLNSCPRLLLEPQRTNGIRNSTMVGAVAGSPGTIPTNWKVLAGSGLTRTVVGIGTENGLPYIDLRYNGIASGTGELLGFEQDTQIAASNGQSWSLSCYVKIISGTANSFSLNWSERNALAGFLVGAVVTISPTSTLQRFTLSGTLTGGATVAAVQPFIRAVVTIGATYDFTIRIAAPQMELGAYDTTWVPTTTAAVTRLADNFTRSNIFTNGFITAAGGTWFVDLSNQLELARSASTAGIYIDTGIGGFTNGFTIRNTGTISQRLNIAKWVSNVGTSLFTTTTNNIKLAIKWNGTTADVFVNGVKVVSATAFTTTAMQRMDGDGVDVPRFINQMALFPTPLTDAQCIQLTTL
jgi:hypothetical protein